MTSHYLVQAIYRISYKFRNLTRRITEIQSQTQQKRFVRYNSLPNYRLCHVSK